MRTPDKGKGILVCKSMGQQQQIEKVVTQFAGAYMSAQPESVLVDLHDSHVFVTLRQVVCPAEREYARERSSRERLERLFSETFDTVKAELETAVAGIVGSTVRQSRISVDTWTGDAVLMFFVEEPTSPDRIVKQ